MNFRAVTLLLLSMCAVSAEPISVTDISVVDETPLITVASGTGGLVATRQKSEHQDV
jgi:hypothetical protein